MNTDIFTIEAVRADTALLHVPNLHIIIRKAKDNSELWVGQCLDLSICAYSDKRSKKAISKEIFDTITEMAINMMLHRLKKGTIHDLFKAGEENHGEWRVFSTYNNAKKIEELESSYNNLILKSPEPSLQEETLIQTLNAEQINSIIEDFKSRIIKSQNIYELRSAA